MSTEQQRPTNGTRHPSAMPPAEHLKLMEAVIASPDVSVMMHALDVWLLVNACQLSYAHPHLGAELKAHFWELGHRLQQPFAGKPEQMAILEAGWDREHDEERDTPAEETMAHVDRIIATATAGEMYDAPSDAWDYPDGDEDLGTYQCQICGKVATRPPIVVFEGEGHAMKAYELCPECIRQHFVSAPAT